MIEAINELIQEIDTCHELISAQAVEHIHQKYYLVTIIEFLLLNIIFLEITNL